jgi:hypothetical protein
VQNITLQVKIKQVNDQPPSSNVDLQQRDLKITSCRREVTIRVWDRNHRSYLQLKVQEVFGLSLDSTIYSPKR